MTIKEIIGDFKAYHTQQYLTKLQQFEAPAIILQHWTKQVEDFKAGLFKVKGLARKHQVAKAEVIAVYTATAQAYIYSTQTTGAGRVKDHFVTCKTQPTTVLKFETAQGVYYYDAANNQIGSDLNELYLKDIPNNFSVVSKFSK